MMESEKHWRWCFLAWVYNKEHSRVLPAELLVPIVCTAFKIWLEADDSTNRHHIRHPPYTLPETNSSPLKIDPWKRRSMLVAGTVPWSLCILQENSGTGGGVGWWHSCTCTHVRCWGGDDDIHALAHMWDAPQQMGWCDGVVGGWGGVGMMTFMHLHTCEMLRNCWAGVGMMTFMHLHTCEMLRTQNWGSLVPGKHRRSKLAKLEKKL